MEITIQETGKPALNNSEQSSTEIVKKANRRFVRSYRNP